MIENKISVYTITVKSRKHDDPVALKQYVLDQKRYFEFMATQTEDKGMKGYYEELAEYYKRLFIEKRPEDKIPHNNFGSSLI